MKKKYLQLTPFFPTEESFRGPYIFDQVKAITRNSDYDVIVIKLMSFYDKNSVVNYEYQGVKVYNFKVLDFPSSVLPGLFQAINLYRLKEFIQKTIGISMSDVAIIHSHVIYPAGVLSVALGNEFGIKNFIQHHGLDVFQTENGRILKGKLRELNRSYMHRKFIDIVNTTDLNVGVSQKVIDALGAIKGFCNPNAYILYNGVDTGKFYELEEVEQSDIFTIGCIGNFWPLKDHLTLLKALKIVVESGKTLIIKFIGSGPTLIEAKAFIAKHKLESYVEFHAEIDHTELNIFYNSLDLFVLPSYYEALGCVYTEALQVGIPVIAVKGQGIEELIKKEERTYSLIEPHDERRLAELIHFRMTERRTSVYHLDIDLFVLDFMQKSLL
ncbi:hypothetical protein B649_08440 [Candidatus Sulfuricurvum sp. RIFRC-1]|uniref:glycosyltransferase n=1 Tax=Candidatus Sulfuricurvum sp. RIFRC-1 TaxID=1249480 RepID=UPI0002999001|nr:glycosyltransferase [Candidatus Sulfuricurvum sp. RIFRC-1]AFV98000.1 hypothetical protein B649_08440 [Candidatus Sulfuricurvum sp. RIFRC-1]